jgi:hypothetical protein
MKVKSIVGIVTVALVGICGMAIAGQRAGGSVTLWRNSSNQVWAVTGAMGLAHNTSDTTQMIECEYDANSGNPFIECDAYDPSGYFATCFVENPSAGMVTALTTMTATSAIQFELNPTTGTCTDIYITNSSRYPSATTN